MTRQVGTVYDHFRDKPMRHYRCTILNDRPDLDGIADGCCHFECRLQALRDAGYVAEANQQNRNAEARDWLHNWGKMVFDPQQHGRDAKRRKAAAAIVRSMRNNTTSYGQACAGGAWLGALISC